MSTLTYAHVSKTTIYVNDFSSVRNSLFLSPHVSWYQDRMLCILSQNLHSPTFILVSICFLLPTNFVSLLWMTVIFLIGVICLCIGRWNVITFSFIICVRLILWLGGQFGQLLMGVDRLCICAFFIITTQSFSSTQLTFFYYWLKSPLRQTLSNQPVYNTHISDWSQPFTPSSFYHTLLTVFP